MAGLEVEVEKAGREGGAGASEGGGRQVKARW